MGVRGFLEWSLVIACIFGLWSALSLPVIFFVTTTTYTPSRRFNSSECDVSNSEDNCMGVLNTTSDSVVDKSVTCQKNFYFDQDFQGCVPSCQTWSEQGETATIALRVIVLAFASIGILLSIVVIIVSIMKHKLIIGAPDKAPAIQRVWIREAQMFQFPTVFLVLSTIDIIFIHLIVLIGYSNSSIFCSSPTILNNTSTPFCIISGMVFNYCYVQQSLWWILHLLVIFWGVWFPFNYNKFKNNGNLRKVMIALTITGILIPVLSIIITVSDAAVSVNDRTNVTILSRGLGYSSPFYLPLICTGRLNFYTYIIPLILALAAGGPLIVLIIFRFCKKRSAGASDIKLILVLVAYLLLTCVSIAVFMVLVRNGDSRILSLRRYFNCERQGIQPDYSCPRDFEQFNLSYAIAVVLVVLALYPSYVLLFAVNITKIKNTFQNIFCGHMKDNSSKNVSVMLSEF